ncbi:NupC/NupG family nucleoside CNT transporter [Pseudoalteromonas shioyasakiensis]|jgi:CNT family concentrative nucleoside transporter|uniref:NupC/NupG family nucleoside CNT transporter n=3 Tax=Pseudoalteromonas TaxID=53246 RepID=UPI00101EDA09|nr:MULTISPECIES: NupC/NupG family nucleoside CNT transporter [Pseudoalteromonas]HIM95263.1 NupC/NupG family nucleoside CNT transporter [Gammaproteobacteria bacterium]MCG9710703.1 NupC/NupG family nucleoside CNT transporter [Pseudoalteromonas sp. Isolate3]MCP4585887.1 NupC/NupG family nucleoside CNT transporter [Pseudoalteromonas sp.]MCQ8880727.1 NupC/NupG family nucleoside CNT transporter [Pseudoalteromonas shioyasakiensis]MDI4653863.1 NupC/NupG family nucleoside CNT transporter [Pseudoalterom|eukprot:m.25174 g.25174  ORF g.25174 m.25174 type:complete len:408 (-) comp4215_c0_seq1:389-1612(-)
MTTFMSLVGIVVLLGIAFAASTNRKAINLRTVGIAFLLQVLIGGFVLFFEVGKNVLASMSRGVSSVIGYANDGISFLFGSLASQDTLGFIFAIQVLPVIVFFSALVAVLYHIGVMDWIIKILGGGLQKLLKTSRPESLSATANIFVGQTEAPLIVKPFIASMTKSELFAVMVGGLATVAGSVMAGYVTIGVELKYLIAASFMAAPGGFLMAKMIVPETETPKEDLADLDVQEEKPVNVIDAAASGAANGMHLALNVGAMLLAFVALIALLNGLLGGIGGWFDHPTLTLQEILGYVFAPVAWLLGVPWNEAVIAGSFIGQKVVVNEFVAYLDFINYRDTLSAHTQAIVTFALCGFANLSSIAILLGGLGGMAPSRRKDIARLGLRAVLAGSMANLMSAAIAGFFLSLA